MDMRAKEPALNTGSTVGFLAAIYVIVNVIWPGLLSDNVQSAISEIALILVPIIAGLLIRAKVFAPASVDKLQRELIDLKKEHRGLIADYGKISKGVPYKESSVEDY